MFDIEDIDGGKILMGNDIYCEVTAIGKIKILNHNKVIVFLTEVRYSATVRRNLISLGQLESLGCWFQSKDFRLNVFRGKHCVKGLQCLVKNGFLKGIDIVDKQECKHCVLGKFHWLSFKKASMTQKNS